MKLLSSVKRLPVNLVKLQRTMTSSAASSDEVIFSVQNNVGLITLNRPKALNSLNLNMAKLIRPQLQEWENNQLKFVVIEGAGEKAFCAGGDIRDITSQPKGSVKQGEFFAAEYKMNHLIGNLGIPYVALIDGITMGGGVGLSVHAPYRVATSKTMFAMPETGIGLVPDVGGSYFLPRLQGELGTFMALTGFRLKGADCVHAGVATHGCQDSSALKQDLLEAKTREELPEILRSHDAQYDRGVFGLEDKLPLINQCFQFDQVEKIIDELDKTGDPWAKKQADLMRRMSPTSMKVTLEMVRRGKSLSLAECLAMEYRLCRRCCEDDDFYEGVRALLVDKDNKPNWNPASLEAVDKSRVDRYFSQLPSGEELVIQ